VQRALLKGSEGLAKKFFHLKKIFNICKKNLPSHAMHGSTRFRYSSHTVLSDFAKMGSNSGLVTQQRGLLLTSLTLRRCRKEQFC
jgi:hypothetical protein